jgi:hypothetical protein
MTETKINELTPQERKQLPKYRTKWQKVALSTERINRTRAAKAIKAVYAYANKPEPEILFCDSPNLAILTQLWSQQKFYIPKYILRKIRKHMNKTIREKVGRSLRLELHDLFFEPPLSQFNLPIYRYLAAQITAGLETHQMGDDMILPEEGLHVARLEMSFYAYYDFCKLLVDSTDIEKEWRILQALCKECQWSFAFEKVCIICDRPTQILLDSRKQLHGESALQFADGYGFNADHGVLLLS